MQRGQWYVQSNWEEGRLEGFIYEICKGAWRCRSRRGCEVALGICTGKSLSYFLFVRRELGDVVCLHVAHPVAN